MTIEKFCRDKGSQQEKDEIFSNAVEFLQPYMGLCHLMRFVKARILCKGNEPSTTLDDIAKTEWVGALAWRIRIFKALDLLQPAWVQFLSTAPPGFTLEHRLESSVSDLTHFQKLDIFPTAIFFRRLAPQTSYPKETLNIPIPLYNLIAEYLDIQHCTN